MGKNSSEEPTVVVAEIGVNHNGDLDIAHKLCDEAHRAKADAVKFQTFSAENLVTRSTVRAPYQLRSGETSQMEMLSALELSDDGFREVMAHCKDLGLLCFSTPYDERSVEFLASVGVPMIKIASADIVNRPLLEAAAETGLPIVQSTGMASMTEVARAVELIQSESSAELTLLHCVTSYPLETAQVNLQWMDALRTAFRIPVGYSDHTTGTSIPMAAVARGAVMIEKHFTLSRDLEGPDHAASLEPDQFAAMLAGIREVEESFGEHSFGRAPGELENVVHMRRSLHARTDIPAGQVLTRDDLVPLRPANGIDPWEIENVIGRTLQTGLNAGEAVLWDHF